MDERGDAAILEAATKCKEAVARGQWQKATEFWRKTQMVLDSHSNYVDFYNVLKYRMATGNTKELPAMFVDGMFGCSVCPACRNIAYHMGGANPNRRVMSPI